MPDTRLIREFKVVVDEHRIIKASARPSTINIERQTLKLDDMQRRTIQLLATMLRENRLLKRDELEVLGENLYSVLFDNEIGRRLNSALDQAIDFLRVELEFEADPQLASWPWEYLCRPVKGQSAGYFLAAQAKLILARRVTLFDLEPRDLMVKGPPLQVLFVAASPIEKSSQEKDANNRMPQVQYESVLNELREIEQLKEARSTDNVERNLIEVITLEPWTKRGEKPSDDNPAHGTFAHFQELVRKTDPHVIHFIGHGECAGARGGIFFMRSDGTPHWVDQGELANAVSAAPSLKLVFLQACESALADPYQAVSGCAMELAGRNIPAVVGMQYEVGNEVANKFAREFYKALADYQPVDVAVQKARLAIQTASGDWEKYRAFGLPVLYLKQLGEESGALLARPPSLEESDGRRRDQRQISEGEALIPSRPDEPRRSSLPDVGLPTEPSLICPWCGLLCLTSLTYCSRCHWPLMCPKCKRRVEIATKLCLHVDCGEQFKPVQTVSVFAARAAAIG